MILGATWLVNDPMLEVGSFELQAMQNNSMSALSMGDLRLVMA